MSLKQLASPFLKSTTSINQPDPLKPEYFPTPIPKTLLQFDKVDVNHYVVTPYVPLKVLVSIRATLTLLNIAMLVFSVVYYHYHANVDYHFASPLFLLQVIITTYFSAVMVIMFHHRTTMKQTYEYISRFEPLPINFPIKCVHTLYSILLVITPVYLIADITLFSKSQHYIHYAKLNENIDLIYKIVILLVILVEFIINNVKLLTSHCIIVYLTVLSYFTVISIIRVKKDLILLFPQWFAYYDHTVVATKTFPFIFTLSLVCIMANIMCALYIFLQRITKWCKPQIKRSQEFQTNAVYFFNTSEFGTKFSLSMLDHQATHEYEDAEILEHLK